MVISSALAVATIAGCAASPKTESWDPPQPGFAPAGSPVAMHGQLRVLPNAADGTTDIDGGGTGKGIAVLVDQSGAPVQLKGVSSHWLQWESQPYAESKGGMQFMRDRWKLSVFRAAMGTDEKSGGYLAGGAGLKNSVEAIIHHAIDLGVYVIVDWHTEQAVKQQEASVAFFTEMATKYGAYPNVIWEPYNEPKGFEWAQIKLYHQAVVDAIRAVDPDNLIVLGTPNYSQRVDVAAADPVVGTNLLYTLHWYSCTHGQPFRSNGDLAIAAGAALFVTEFGATFADGGLPSGHYYVCEDEANLWYAWMAEHGISGVAWKLDQGVDSSNIFKANAGLDGNWTDDKLSSDAGGAEYDKGLNVSGKAIYGGHGKFVVDWIRQ